MTTTLTLRPISAAEHRDFIAGQSSASFLQTPAWASVKSEWRNESLGFFRGAALVGVALVLYRQLLGSSATSPTYPEVPVIN